MQTRLQAYFLIRYKFKAQVSVSETPALRAPFSVYIWDEYVPACEMPSYYPWISVKNNLVFDQNNTHTVLNGLLRAQYIIVRIDKNVSVGNIMTITMSEIKAYGWKIKDGSVPLEPTTELWRSSVHPILLEEQVKLGARSWDYFKNHLDLTTYDLDMFHTPEIQSAVQQVIKNYGQYFAHHAPCDWNKYKVDRKTFRSMLNYNKILLAQNGVRITRMPGFNRILGDVHPDARPTSYSVILNVSQAGNFFPVGAYAKAGEAFNYRVHALTPKTLRGYSIQINPQTDFVHNHTELSRWPWVTSSRSLKLTESFSSPVGGVITLAIPENSVIQIVFENVYRYPWFDIRNQKSIDTWERQQALYPHTPFTMVMGDRMITMLPTSSFLRMNTENMKFSVNYYDNVIKLIHNYRGTVFQTEPFMGFVVDEQISMGWGHSGWLGQPMMGHKPWETYFRDIKYILSGYAIFIIHEIGHNLQPSDLTFTEGTEVTNELFIPLVYQYLLKIPAYDFGVYPGLAHTAMQKLVQQWRNKTYTGVRLSYYYLLGHYFGPGLVGNVLMKKTKDLKWLSTEEDIIHYWLEAVSLESGYDLIPYHRLWHFPIEQRTVIAVQALPCFFPRDELTMNVSDIADEILFHSRKTCSHEVAGKVNFRGDLFRGINKVEKQFIFFQPVPSKL
ncbi:hypothetical protein EG68_11269 [Paragonimus skrjabini miyazakii]|uniref:Peptidase M60 domain-containing protein n=1 Tax=Paragonimus skrjabini miyazakii TaxID=59628 RepID=A0A8S9YE18_9TREM|nr:hypothetical protein EG68_11269 [Paragonimus skrjabini miyazakii]